MFPAKIKTEKLPRKFECLNELQVDKGAGIKAGLGLTKGLQLTDLSVAGFVSDSQKSEVSVSWRKWLPQPSESGYRFHQLMENVR